MIVGFTVLLLVLLGLGLPVAFALGLGGVSGMLAFIQRVRNSSLVEGLCMDNNRV